MEFVKPKNKRYDKFIYGFLLGVLGPIVGMVLYYLVLFNQYSINRLFEMLGENTNLQSPMLSVSLIFNLALLYVVFRFDFTKIGQGIVAGTFVYVPIVLILKFVE